MSSICLSDLIMGNSFIKLNFSIFFLERDLNNLIFARFQAAVIIHNSVQIYRICRGWGRRCIASGQAGKAQCNGIYWISGSFKHTQLCRIYRICRGRGRCCVASGQAGKARCVKSRNNDIVYCQALFEAKRSSNQFEILCSWTNSLTR